MSSLLDFTVQGEGTIADEWRLPQVKLMAPLELYRLGERQNWSPTRSIWSNPGQLCTDRNLRFLLVAAEGPSGRALRALPPPQGRRPLRRRTVG